MSTYYVLDVDHQMVIDSSSHEQAMTIARCHCMVTGEHCYVVEDGTDEFVQVAITYATIWHSGKVAAVYTGGRHDEDLEATMRWLVERSGAHTWVEVWGVCQAGDTVRYYADGSAEVL